MRLPWSPLSSFVWGLVCLSMASVSLTIGCNISDPLAGADDVSVDPEDSSSNSTSSVDATSRGPATDAGGDRVSDRDAKNGADRSDAPDATQNDTGPDAGPDTGDREVEPDVESDTGECPRGVDGSCECTPGETRNCYTGPQGTRGIGACSDGTAECQSDGTWGTCEGEQTPSPEQCADGIDNDCDGAADEADDDCMKSVGESCTSDTQCPGSCLANESGDLECAHRVFVTSSTYSGGFGGIQAGDTKCTAAAGNANLGGNWRAILSSRRFEARQRINLRGPVANADGERLADGPSDFWNGSLANPVGYDEFGHAVQTNVWTGTQSNGRAASSRAFCGKNWDSNAPVKEGATGDSDSARFWVEDINTVDCKTPLPIYCIDGQ